MYIKIENNIIVAGGCGKHNAKYYLRRNIINSNPRTKQFVFENNDAKLAVGLQGSDCGSLGTQSVWLCEDCAALEGWLW